MVLAIVTAAFAALVYVLVMFAPVSARRGVAFTMLAVCFGLLGACAFGGIWYLAVV